MCIWYYLDNSKKFNEMMRIIIKPEGKTNKRQSFLNNF